MAARQFDNWIGGFIEYTSAIKSPERYRRWVGVSTISAILGRRVYTWLQGQIQYPNLYLLLVGPSGVGKSNAIKHAEPLLEATGIVHLSPSRLTRWAFYDEVEEAGKKGHHINIKAPGGPDIRHEAPFTAYVTEMGVFLHAGDDEFFDELTDLYDNPTKFKYKTRTAGKSEASNVTFNFVTACTPRKLRKTFTDELFEAGLPSRFIMIWSDPVAEPDPFGVLEDRTKIRKQLVTDLERISRLSGEYFWTQDAQDFIRSWINGGMKPRPDSPHFEGYNTRRLSHVTKVALCIAAARHDEPLIRLEDIVASHQIILEAESVMEACVGGVGSNPLFESMKLAVRVCSAAQRANGGEPVREDLIRRALTREVSPHMMKPLLENLQQNNWLVRWGENAPYKWTANDKYREQWAK